MVGFWVGVTFIVAGRLLAWNVRRYEFYNMSDGGVVQFPSYARSRVHLAKGRWASTLVALGVLVFMGTAIAALS